MITNQSGGAKIINLGREKRPGAMHRHAEAGAKPQMAVSEGNRECNRQRRARSRLLNLSSQKACSWEPHPLE